MTKPIHYLATPYSDYGQGREQAFVEAAIVAARLMKMGFFIFSPIAHSHPIAIHGGIDAVDHDFWLAQDKAMLDECAGLLVVMMPGWRESKGVAAEIQHAKVTEKPICYLTWPMLTVREDEG